MLILSGYGATTGTISKTTATAPKVQTLAVQKRTTEKPPEEPGFFSTFFTKAAEGLVSSVTGQPQDTAQTQYYPQYNKPQQDDTIFGINKYYVYAGAGIGVLGLLLVLKKIRAKRHKDIIVAQPISPIQIPSGL